LGGFDSRLRLSTGQSAARLGEQGSSMAVQASGMGMDGAWDKIGREVHIIAMDGIASARNTILIGALP
jgi:hypothetical protein